MVWKLAGRKRLVRRPLAHKEGASSLVKAHAKVFIFAKHENTHNENSIWTFLHVTNMFPELCYPWLLRNDINDSVYFTMKIYLICNTITNSFEL